jgi:hypothetical protein
MNRDRIPTPNRKEVVERSSETGEATLSRRDLPAAVSDLVFFSKRPNSPVQELWEMQCIESSPRPSELMKDLLIGLRSKNSYVQSQCEERLRQMPDALKNLQAAPPASDPLARLIHTTTQELIEQASLGRIAIPKVRLEK